MDREQYPDMMDFAVPFCGSAKTSLHNQVFLEGVKSAMLAAKGIRSAGSKEGAVAVKGQKYREWSEEEREVGMKAFGRGYAGWYVVGTLDLFGRSRSLNPMIGGLAKRSTESGCMKSTSDIQISSLL